MTEKGGSLIHHSALSGRQEIVSPPVWSVLGDLSLLASALGGVIRESKGGKAIVIVITLGGML